MVLRSTELLTQHRPDATVREMADPTEALVSEPKFWQTDLDWDDPSLSWHGDESRVLYSLHDIGDPNDSERPVVMLLKYAPGHHVTAHWHDSDYCSIVAAGELTVTGRLHGAGAVRLVAAGTTYGPLKAGPLGARVVDIFTNRNGVTATHPQVDPKDVDRKAAEQAELRGKIADLPSRPIRRGK